MKRTLTLICVLILFGVVNNGSYTAAQVSNTPLMELLALVPFELEGELRYMDFSAIEQAYPPARMPANWSEYESLTPDTAAQQFPLDVWNSVFLASGGPFTDVLYRGEDIPGAMGIDWFQTRRALLASFAPQQTIYLQGAFDVEAIHVALTARGYALDSTAQGFELWCGADGCEHSHVADPSRIEHADIFGGGTGQQWARLIAPDMLVGSSQPQSMQRVVDISAGEALSLADHDAVQAAVAALRDQGVLLQALIPNVRFQESLSFPPFDPLTTPNERRAEARALLDAGYETLPPYETMMFASLVTETEQISQVILVYGEAADAEISTRIIPTRLASYRSSIYQQPLTRILEQMRVSRIEADLMKVGDYAVVRLTFATPKATAEEIIAFGATLHNPDVTQPGTLYNVLLRFYQSLDLDWLSTATREELVAIAARGN